ncbi:MAG: hypothetical protein U0797_29505 [Gemmataceae bacterium]
MTHPPVSEQAMIDRLRGQPGRGTFEAHVTVDAADLAERERFRAACDELSAKCVLIELPRGQTRSQPMTATYHRGDLAEVVEQVAGLARSLRQRGFRVTRLKLEAVTTNEGVPATDEEARAFPAGNYFEFHVKLTLPAEGDLDALRVVCTRHAAHLSLNALRDDSARRFVTMRVYGVGRVNAEVRFDDLCKELTALGYPLSNRLKEYAIYDSNAAVDAGWIDPPAGAGNAGGA